CRAGRRRPASCWSGRKTCCWCRRRARRLNNSRAALFCRCAGGAERARGRASAASLSVYLPRKIFAKTAISLSAVARERPALYKSILRPLLFRKDPESSHAMILHLLARAEFLAGVLEGVYNVVAELLSETLGALTFPNVVGLAGAVPENAVAHS